MTYTAEHIAGITGGKLTGSSASPVEHLLLDSRRIYSPSSSVFFALKGFRRDGHLFIPELYEKGVRCFVVSREQETARYPEAAFILVNNTLDALQQLAAEHRSRFDIPVIGITGSNGKTVVKEWLWQLLHEDYEIIRSPKSYNSQIGVPLSVWGMNERHTLAIFEAGISRPGEMEKLEKIIRPTIGILTNIGDAHSEGFGSRQEKEKEKRKLFRNATLPAELQVTEVHRENGNSTITTRAPEGGELSITIPFTDAASEQNAVTCWQLMRILGYRHDVIAERMKNLLPVNMRLEMKKGINGCLVINDSYSADTSSLEIALGFLQHQAAGASMTVILSDLLQSSTGTQELYKQVKEDLLKHKISRVIGIGEMISQAFAADPPAGMEVQTFLSTDDFLQHFRFSGLKDEYILVKGARVFAFERIVQHLELKAHQTVLEVNLSAVAHNLKAYQQLLNPQTRVMAMVKAFAYGSGGAEIAGILQFHKVDYLGVAYADEGVELRKAGISLPVMVINPEENAFEAITEYNLEPELYSFDMLEAFDRYLRREGLVACPVHIEIETGMNRLGFATDEMEKLASMLKATSSFRVVSVFSHLAASEEEVQDSFTQEQFNRFTAAASVLEKNLGYSFIRHIANSAAAERHPDMQLDMVRLGIGLYGAGNAPGGRLNLQTVATLKSTIAQVKHLRKGDSVSYNRHYVAENDRTIATIRIGYADGYPRRLGNGTGRVWVQGNLFPVAGTVCMDMFMIDITGHRGIREGDEVILFGEQLPVKKLAEMAGTIPYEILTGISQRVKRVYFQE